MSRNLILTIITIIVVSVFSGCGNTDEASFENSSSSSSSTSTTTIAIDVVCTTPATISTYISLQSGDTIVENSDGTSIETYHDATGVKKVCLVAGSASIIR